MIETLDGIYETVNYKQSTSLKLYDNVEYEDYPMHWHPAIEIIMPVENSYKLVFSSGEVVLKENDICIICPGCVHSIIAPPTGRRIIFQPNQNTLRFLREVEVLFSIMSPFCIITPKDYPDIQIEAFFSDSKSDFPIAQLAKHAYIIRKNNITEWIV